MIRFSVFMTSFSILAYEIVFTRIFAWSQWVNLSPLIITMALLGFGAAGSLISLFEDWIEKREEKVFSAGLVLFPLFLAAGFIIPSHLTFNPYELDLEPAQIGILMLYFLFMAMAFFLGAVVICLSYMGQDVRQMVFYNLTGSGVGALVSALLSFYVHPVWIMAGIGVAACLPALVLMVRSGTAGRRLGAGAAAILVMAGLWQVMTLPRAWTVSQYKSISMALALPEARMVYEAFSPLGIVQVVEAKGLRSTAGLSLVSPFQVPVQKGIFFNAGAMSPITPFSGATETVRYLEYLSSYLPFHIMDRADEKKVLIIGAGGGESILKSLVRGFGRIDALELDPHVIRLMKGPFAAFSGYIYENSRVNVIHREARSFIQQTGQAWDLIEISLIDGYTGSASGVHALNENYLYTREALAGALGCLTDTGLLTVTRWIVTPARDNLKMFHMAVEALADVGVKPQRDCLLAVRSLQTLTLVMSRSPLSRGMIDASREFARERGFDLDYFPGIQPEDADRFIRLNPPVYYRAMQELLSDRAWAFINAYSFDITAATDNRPYFHNFFKPALVKTIRTYGPSQIPVTEWGWLILAILLVPVLLTAFGCILLPVIISRYQGRYQMRPGQSTVTAAYFSLIGAAYFFVEMPLIQKMGLFLGHPSYSFTVVIAGLLIFSGLGSLLSNRVFDRTNPMSASCLIISALVLTYVFGADFIFSWAMAWPAGFKILLVLLLLFLPGFFMGMPFACGLARIKQDQSTALPWAWAVNGFAGVASILVAALLAILSGFNTVLLLAAVFYALAGILSYYPDAI
jgi:spermidine synthase